MLKILRSNTDINKESNRLHQIADENDYDPKIIVQFQNNIKKENTQTANKTNIENKPTYTTITYHATMRKAFQKYLNVNLK